jgi:A/G-specific adenine glycosylase
MVFPNVTQSAYSLVKWFERNARDLPWRRTSDPYAIWISEIMLQQTQVKTVIPYFERWMGALPTVEKFAKARPERVLKLWEGLGYYSRVRNAQAAARLIVSEHGGKFPNRFEDILALPGIGRYTAGAISSIAFGLPEPILDGNVVRVLTRVFGIEGDPKGKEVNAQLWEAARAMVSVPKIEPSKLNQALMELGALVCLPRQPRCAECPVRQYCFAFRTHRVADFPALAARKAPTERRFIALVAREEDRFLVRQRPSGIVNAGLWEFPNIEVPMKAKPPEELGLGEPFFRVRHSITRYRILLEVFEAKADSGMEGVWKTLAEMEKLAFTSAHRKVMDAVRKI